MLPVVFIISGAISLFVGNFFAMGEVGYLIAFLMSFGIAIQIAEGLEVAVKMYRDEI